MSNTRRTTPPRTSAPVENKANGKPVMFDLDAYQAEAQREPFSFSLAGKTFVLPHLSDLDWHLGIGEDGRPGDPTVYTLLRSGLGDQWAQFNKLKLTAAGYNALWEKWQQHSGVELGESSASPAS